MNKIILFIIILTYIFIGCKDDISQPSDLSGRNLLHKIYYDDNLYQEYFYDDLYRIVKIESYNNLEVNRRDEYYYDEKGFLIRANNFINELDMSFNSYNLYEYNDIGILDKSSSYLFIPASGYDFRSYQLYEHDSNNRIVKSTLYNSDNEIRAFWDYIYDANGNLICRNMYQKDGPSFHNKYEYDNKNNPLQLSINSFIAANLSPNNVTFKIDSISTGVVSKLNYTYEYNSNDYPIIYIYNSVIIKYEYY